MYQKAQVNGLSCYMVHESQLMMFHEAVRLLLVKQPYSNNRFLYPGPLPVSLTLDIIAKKVQKRRNEYLVMEKNDGDRACLVFTRVNKLKVTFIISRQGSVYLLPAFKTLSHEVFKGTVMDTELIRINGGKHKLVVFDCLCIAGINQEQDFYMNRVEKAKTLLQSVYKESPDDRVNLRVKLMYHLESEFEGFLARFTDPDIKDEIDGIIFALNVSGVVYARDMDMYKWKDPINNTIDFLYNGGHLHVFDKGQNLRIAPLSGNHGNDIKDGAIVECAYDVSTQAWKAIKVRTDKHHSNDIKTYNATMKTIRDDISLDTLIRAISNHKSRKSNTKDLGVSV